VPDAESRWRVDLVKSTWRGSREPVQSGCSCPACGPGFSRGYLHYLFRAGELTALRLLTLHNLTFIKTLMDRLHDAIDRDELPAVTAALRG
jgi:queuine tRNA-ribosyltransferase